MGSTGTQGSVAQDKVERTGRPPGRRRWQIPVLLLVVLGAGVVAARWVRENRRIAIENAYVASMQSDLLNLTRSEEAYFVESAEYGSLLECAARLRVVVFCATPGNKVSVSAHGAGVSAGWTARVTNPNTTKRCAMYVGPIEPLAPATTADPQLLPVCR